MSTSRREFLHVSAAAVAGTAAATVACGGGPGGATAAASVSALLQFSGLILHAHEAGPSAYEFASWDALLVHGGNHVPHLRISLANVDNPQPYDAATRPLGYHVDRTDPTIGIWHLRGTDVEVRLDTSTKRTVTGKRGRTPGAQCPTTASEYDDITWVLDVSEVYTSAKINKKFKEAPGGFPANAVLSRVRLPEGEIGSTLPSVEDADHMLVHFGNLSKGHFVPDILRHTTKSAGKIQIVMTSFAGTSTETLTLVGSSGPVLVRVENHDPTLAKQALQGKIDEKKYWEEHFKPYKKLLASSPSTDPVPTLDCCPGQSCDPPFYCIPPGGTYAP